MIQVSVEYFALFREHAGRASEALSTDMATAADLYQFLRQKYGFGLEQEDVKVAVNDCFVDWNHPVVDNDTLVFIPPVSGG